jgi:hypothetical protein
MEVVFYRPMVLFHVLCCSVRTDMVRHLDFSVDGQQKRMGCTVWYGTASKVGILWRLCCFHRNVLSPSGSIPLQRNARFTESIKDGVDCSMPPYTNHALY